MTTRALPTYRFLLLLAFAAALLASGGARAAAQYLRTAGAGRRSVNPAAQALGVPFNPYYAFPVVERGAPEDLRLPAPEEGDWLASYPETGLTFLEFVTNRLPRPTLARQTICIRPLGRFRDERALGRLAELVSAYFQLPVKVLAPGEVSQAFYRPEHRKYDGDDLLLQMNRELPREAYVYVGITDRDLRSGKLNTVFGLAYSDLRSCVVSTKHVLAKETEVRDRAELLRLFKLVSHEIGHVLGLPHCAAHHCVMNGTTSLADVETAPVVLCGQCLRKVQWLLEFDSLKRYEGLRLAMRANGLEEQALAYEPRLQRLRGERLAEKALALVASRQERVEAGNESPLERIVIRRQPFMAVAELDE